MRLLCVLMATLLGVFMIIRSAIRFWKRGRDRVNVNEDPGLVEGALVDFLMLVLGAALVLPLILFLLN